MLVAAALIPAPAHAQAVTDNADARAIVLTGGALVASQTLNFGDIVANTAGTVTVTATGAVTVTGGVVPLASIRTPGRFTGSGTRNRLIRLTITPTQITVTNGTGGSMIVDNFTIGALSGLNQNGNSSNYRIVAANGMFTFNVGARLNIAANQPPGNYSGVYSVDFNFQ